MKEKYTLTSDKNITGMARTIESFLRFNKKMDSQIIDIDNCHIVQARTKGGTFKKFIGMDKAITIKIEKTLSNEAVVEIANGKWVDKGLIFLLSMVVLWPLTITSVVGAYMQGTLPGEIKNEISRYLTA